MLQGRSCSSCQLKTHTPLLIDANAELPLAIAAQRLKSIAGQEHQVASADRRLQNIQTPLGLLLERLKLPDSLSRRKTLGAFVAVFGRNNRLHQPDHELLSQK
jgi:hypothetical protein